MERMNIFSKKANPNKGKELLLTNNVPFSVEEAYKSLRTNLIFSMPEETCKVIEITSANQHEGKSVTAINLAVALAKNGYRVLGKEGLKNLVSEQLKEISISNNFTCVQGGDYGYGLGVRIRQVSTDWGLNKGEFGWDGAAGSYVMMDSEKKVSIFIGLHLRNWPLVFKGKYLPIVEKIYRELAL
jgi:hypothetical protein